MRAFVGIVIIDATIKGYADLATMIFALTSQFESKERFATVVTSIWSNDKFTKGFRIGIIRSVLRQRQRNQINFHAQSSNKSRTSTSIDRLPRDFLNRITSHWPMSLNHDPRSFQSYQLAGSDSLFFNPPERLKCDPSCNCCDKQRTYNTPQWWPAFRFFWSAILLLFGGWIIYNYKITDWWSIFGNVCFFIGWFGLLLPFGW